MKQFITLFLLTMGVATTSIAQSGKITGIITDEKKETIIGAIVQVLQNNVVKGTASSDIDGKYEVILLPTGKYELRVTYVGYKTNITTNILVRDKKTTRLNVQLEADHNSLDEISIVEYKVPLKSKEAMHKMPTRDVKSMVSAAPGVYQSSDAGALSIGGARGNGNLVYLNPSTESYAKHAENEFMNVKSNPLSTLSVDVDRASYSNVRRFINQGQKPPADAVRVEEMINYFDYDYPQPKGDDPIAITTTLVDCPWQPKHKLLHVGMQARKIPTDNLPASNLVFLLDVSGSMNEANKLPLVKSALKLLVNNLREEDKVSIVVYAGAAGLVLPATSGNDKRTIINALDKLEAGGSTAGGAGIKLAYKTAQENFVAGGNNRIIIATDGDFNVGVSGDNELEDLITKQRNKGIFLTCLGFGMGNYKDSKLEILADKGNGNYAYIDNIQEAQKTLVKEFGGTLFTVAKDVKAQIEFNPAKVQAYRVVGYENRMLNEEDFKDDKKDAGEMGSGHTVTILYEIIPIGVNSKHVRGVNDLKYQFIEPTYDSELATIKFRYKQPDGNKSKEMVHPIKKEARIWESTSENIRFSSAVALFGMLLKDSKFKGQGDYKTVLMLAQNARGKDKEGYRAEFIRLVKAISNTDGEEGESEKTSSR